MTTDRTPEQARVDQLQAATTAATTAALAGVLGRHGFTRDQRSPHILTNPAGNVVVGTGPGGTRIKWVQPHAPTGMGVIDFPTGTVLAVIADTALALHRHALGRYMSIVEEPADSHGSGETCPACTEAGCPNAAPTVHLVLRLRRVAGPPRSRAALQAALLDRLGPVPCDAAPRSGAARYRVEVPDAAAQPTNTVTVGATYPAGALAARLGVAPL